MNKRIVDEGRLVYAYNATDHSPHGGTHVRVTVRWNPINSQWEWSIDDFTDRPRITDSGSGIDPADCQRQIDGSLAPSTVGHRDV